MRPLECADCGLKASAAGHVPVDVYMRSTTKAWLLCLGCLATRRQRHESWERTA